MAPAPLDYPATCFEALYRDANGTESIIFHTDGRRHWSPSNPRAAAPLRTTIRDLAFEGASFDGLGPVGSPEVAEASGFTLRQGSLCVCEFELRVPVQARHRSVLEGVTLLALLTLAPPSEEPGSHGDRLVLSVTIGGQTFSASGDGDFETTWVALQKMFPGNTYLRSCFHCAYSDYSVYGKSSFGTMTCFRRDKARYLAVRTKDEYFPVMEAASEDVQETFVCQEFSLRRPGTGYRG